MDRSRFIVPKDRLDDETGSFASSNHWTEPPEAPARSRSTPDPAAPIARATLRHPLRDFDSVVRSAHGKACVPGRVPPATAIGVTLPFPDRPAVTHPSEGPPADADPRPVTCLQGLGYLHAHCRGLVSLPRAHSVAPGATRANSAAPDSPRSDVEVRRCSETYWARADLS